MYIAIIHDLNTMKTILKKKKTILEVDANQNLSTITCYIYITGCV